MTPMNLTEATACICRLKKEIEALEDAIANQNDLDEQILSTDDSAGYTTSITISNGNTVPIIHPPSADCNSEIVSRGALLGLRNAGTLDPCTTYIIPAYSRGCLSGDIMMHADDESTLSMDVNILTQWDTESWEGRYDIQTNRVVEVKDNRKNYVSGRTGVEVDRFPWGNPNWNEVRIESADVLTECDPQMRLTNVRFDTDSYVDMRGAAGYVINSSYESDADHRFRNATGVRIQALKAESASIMRGDGSSNMYILRATMMSAANASFAGQDEFRLVNSSMSDSSTINYTGGDRCWLYYSRMGSYSRIRVFSGDYRRYYSDMDSYGEDRNEAGSAGWFTYYGKFSSRAYRRNYNTAQVTSYGDEVGSRGEVNYRGDSVKRSYYNEVKSYGRLRMEGTTTVVYANRIGTQSIITFSAGNHYRNVFDGYAIINTAFLTRSVIVHGRFTQTLTAANVNKGRGYWGNTLV